MSRNTIASAFRLFYFVRQLATANDFLTIKSKYMSRSFSYRLVLDRIVLVCVSALLFTACKTETLFQSDFDAGIVNSPPAHTQKVGTVNIDGPSGNVKIVSSPAGTSERWVQITRTQGQQSVTGLQCNFSKFAGDGIYHFSTALFIPQGAGLVTVQFETFGQPVGTLTSFLHIDFTQDNRLRIDDNDDTKFGSFPRDAVFILLVTLNINDSVSTAHISLAGANTEGSLDYSILPPFRTLARQFGAARLWMGFPWTGSFDATDIVVTRDL